MLLRPFLFFLGLLVHARPARGQEFASDITTVIEGSELIAKVPCIDCPFLVAHSTGNGGREWSRDWRDNALLLNVSLAYGNSYLLLNGQPIWPLPHRLPSIYAVQAPEDITVDALQSLASNGVLDSHNATETGCASFGLSYVHSVRFISKPLSFVVQFDVFALWTDLPKKPLSHMMSSSRQMLLQVILLRRPVYSALEPVSFEIVKAELLLRDHYATEHVGFARSGDMIMHFLDWDDFGRRRTVVHFLLWVLNAFVSLLVLDARVVIIIAGGISFLALILAFYAIYYLIRYGTQDDYDYAQQGKSAVQRKRRNDDEERGGGFFNREELGMLRRAQIAGLEKHD